MASQGHHMSVKVSHVAIESNADQDTQHVDLLYAMPHMQHLRGARTMITRVVALICQLQKIYISKDIY